jgi:hypothetical protein
MSVHPTKKLCTFPDCGRKHESKGLCRGHCEQQYDGRPLKPLMCNQVNCVEKVVGASWQIGKAKTHCKRGHSYEKYGRVKNNGSRACRECENSAWRKKHGVRKDG